MRFKVSAEKGFIKYLLSNSAFVISENASMPRSWFLLLQELCFSILIRFSWKFLKRTSYSAGAYCLLYLLVNSKNF